MKLLFVDDEKDFLAMLHVFFQKDERFAGDTFFLAANAQEARALLHDQGPFDVVIADYHMPGEDGLSLASFIRRLSPKTHLIILSSYDMIADKAHDLCDAFWTKPADLKALSDYVFSIKK